MTLDITMKYCCDSFKRECEAYSDGFYQDKNGDWHVSAEGFVVLRNIHFCPFCGANLTERKK